jgi:hypothetical protein
MHLGGWDAYTQIPLTYNLHLLERAVDMKIADHEHDP